MGTPGSQDHLGICHEEFRIWGYGPPGDSGSGGLPPPRIQDLRVLPTRGLRIWGSGPPAGSGSEGLAFHPPLHLLTGSRTILQISQKGTDPQILKPRGVEALRSGNPGVPTGFPPGGLPAKVKGPSNITFRTF